MLHIYLIHLQCSAANFKPFILQGVQARQSTFEAYLVDEMEDGDVLLLGGEQLGGHAVRTLHLYSPAQPQGTTRLVSDQFEYSLKKISDQQVNFLDNIQGDHSGCATHPIDTNTKVAF